MAVVEFLDRVHEPHVALLDQVEEVEGTVAPVLLRDRYDQSEMSLDHLGAPCPQCSLGAAHLGDRATEVCNRQTDALGECDKFVAQYVQPIGMPLREHLPARHGQRGGGLREPMGIELMADIAAKQAAAGDAAASGQPHKLLFGRLQVLLLVLQLRE